MSKHRIITNGALYRVQTRHWDGWHTETGPGVQLMFVDTREPKQFKSRQKAVEFIRKEYGKRAVILSPPWRQA